MREDFEQQDQQWQQEPLEQQSLQAPQPYYAPPEDYSPQQYAPAPMPQAPETPADDKEERFSAVGQWVAIILACAVIGVVIGGAIVGFLKFVNSPVTAKASADPLEAAREAAGPTTSTNLFKGKQITLQYPSSFNAVNEYNSSTLDSYMISSKTQEQTTLALAVVPLKSMLLEDDSSYKYRLVHPELYTSRQMQLGGEKAVLMTKTDKTEATLFWAHKDMDLNLSLTSSDPKLSPVDVMNQIAPTIRWVQ